MKCFLIGILSLLLWAPLAAGIKMPWTQNELILFVDGEYLFQHFTKVNSTERSSHYRSNSHFFTLEGFGSYYDWSAEASLTCAGSHHRNFGFDNIRLGGSCQWMNDIIDDPLSVTFGVEYCRASRIALHDLSSFHHGQNEVELWASVGKERTCYDTWTSRWWAIAGINIADHGSPWWDFTAAWEKHLRENLIFRFFGHSLIGMGGDSLTIKHFKGYGPIKHRSIDLGVRLTRLSAYGEKWIFEYAQRVYARNFPQCASLFQISYIYPYNF